MPDHSSDNLPEITVNLVGAFLERNHCLALELPVLICATHDSLAKLGTKPDVAPAPRAAAGVVSLKNSLATAI